MFISIHTPLAGSDMPPVTAGLNRLFQSTLPLRGATRNGPQSPHDLSNFNPHSPCGERPTTLAVDATPVQFQSTLPLRGATIHPLTHGRFDPEFQSTLPLRGATDTRGKGAYPSQFQSTLPLRGATHCARESNPNHWISIHTPLAGSDDCSKQERRTRTHFNPHSPCGERLWRTNTEGRWRDISIHTPLAGSDPAVGFRNPDSFHISIHTPLAGSDPCSSRRRPSSANFNPHSPCGERPQK